MLLPCGGRREGRRRRASARRGPWWLIAAAGILDPAAHHGQRGARRPDAGRRGPWPDRAGRRARRDRLAAHVSVAACRTRSPSSSPSGGVTARDGLRQPAPALGAVGACSRRLAAGGYLLFLEWGADGSDQVRTGRGGARDGRPADGAADPDRRDAGRADQSRPHRADRRAARRRWWSRCYAVATGDGRRLESGRAARRQHRRHRTGAGRPAPRPGPGVGGARRTVWTRRSCTGWPGAPTSAASVRSTGWAIDRMLVGSLLGQRAAGPLLGGVRAGWAHQHLRVLPGPGIPTAHQLAAGRTPRRGGAVREAVAGDHRRAARRCRRAPRAAPRADHPGDVRLGLPRCHRLRAMGARGERLARFPAGADRHSPGPRPGPVGVDDRAAR